MVERSDGDVPMHGEIDGGRQRKENVGEHTVGSLEEEHGTLGVVPTCLVPVPSLVRDLCPDRACGKDQVYDPIVVRPRS
jgi:hypothetical protein